MRTLASKILEIITWMMIIIQNYDPNSKLASANSTSKCENFPPSGDKIILFAIIKEQVILMTYEFDTYIAPDSSFNPTSKRVVFPTFPENIQNVYPHAARLFLEDLNKKKLDRGYAFFTRSWDGKRFLTYMNDYNPPASQDYGFDLPYYEISTTNLIANDIFEKKYTFVSTNTNYLYEIGSNGTTIAKMQYAFHDALTLYRMLEGNFSICTTNQSNIQMLKGDCQQYQSSTIDWNLGRAGLLHQERIYLLGKDFVYVFPEKAFTNRPNLYPLEKIPLKEFLIGDPHLNPPHACTKNDSKCCPGNDKDDEDKFNVWWMLLLLLIPVWIIVACYYWYYKRFRSAPARSAHQEVAGQ